MKDTNQLELFEFNYKNYKGDKQICKICKVKKPIEHFNKMGVTALDRRCSSCNKKQAKWIKEQRVLFKHLDAGYCHCCNKQSNRGLHFDHDHNTLEFRGFLCINCNQGIGKLGDNIEGLKQAITYLNTHKENL